MTASKIKIITFLGLPASGKGTQAEILSQKINAKLLGIGDLIREEIDGADTSDPFYADMKEKYNKGIPQSDEVVLDIVKKNIQKHGNKIVFDNFPFSKKQAELFFKLCLDIEADAPVLLIINIARETAEKRILSRRVCASCETVSIDDGNQICEKCGGPLISRSDDNQETLKKRIDEYLPRLNDVKNAFAKSGKVIEIDGEKTIPEVSDQVFLELKNANIV